MNRKHTKFCIHYVFDVVGLSLAWCAAAQLRSVLTPSISGELAKGEIFALNPPVWLMLALWIIAGFWTGRLRPPYGLRDLGTLAECVFLSSCLTIVAIFVARLLRLQLSHVFVLIAAPTTFAGILLARWATAFVTKSIDVHWPSPERVAVLAASDEAAWQIANQIQNSGRRVTVAGLILPHSASLLHNAGLHSDGTQSGRLPLLGTTTTLATLINCKRLDRIIVLNGCATEQEVDECGVISKRMGVVLSRAIKVPEFSAKVELIERFGMPLLDVRPVAFTRRQELIKRCFDVLASSLLLVLAIPALAAIAVMIKLTSRGPVLYKSSRVGRGGRHFTFLKFRSMYIDGTAGAASVRENGKSGHIFKLRDDPRITRCGRFLRKYSLDELPQLANVLRGEMSLVGPRPLPAEDLDPDGQSRQFKSWSEGRSRVLPGITGIWQIQGRSDVPFETMIQLDIDYIRDWSLLVDLRVLLKTPVVVITGKGAY